MSVTLREMRDHLLTIVSTAHLARAAQEAAGRALSDEVEEAHHRDFNAWVDRMIMLICGDPGRAILTAMTDELQAVVTDLGADDPAVAVRA